jgi:hypothetical protein
MLVIMMLRRPMRSERCPAIGVAAKPAAPAEISALAQNLNWRQIKALELFNQHEWIDVGFYMKYLKTNKLMASRDLRLLTEQNLIARFGKGRATRYRRR